jgi:patatin-like phospholipase/acyl hydrolase
MPAKKKVVRKKKVAAKSRPYRILALDGGGIRGLLTAVWLVDLEKRLVEAHGKTIRESFDLVAGTSTGSILACAISLGIPPTRIRDLYLERAGEIFPGRTARLWGRLKRAWSDGVSAPKYDGVGLAAVLRSEFGNVTFGELTIRPTLVTSYNTFTRTAEVFKNTRDWAKDLPVWEIVKSSCSAPTYFPAHVMSVKGARVPLVDGGVVANNPTACAIAEGVRICRDEGIPIGRFVVASFGTGESTRPITIDEAREWGAIEWAIPAIDVLMDGANDAVHYIASQLIPGERYFRFQTRLTDAYDDMDNPDKTNLNALVGLANSYLRRKAGRDQMERLVPLLG